MNTKFLRIPLIVLADNVALQQDTNSQVICGTQSLLLVLEIRLIIFSDLTDNFRGLPVRAQSFISFVFKNFFQILCMLRLDTVAEYLFCSSD